MQEFSSVTASSYDADSLTPMLNAKAGEGWTVVSIVSAGTNIVAYLSRDTDAMIEAAEVEFAVEEAIVEEAIVEEVAAEVAAPVLVDDTALVDSVPVAAVPVAEPAGWALAPESETPPAGDASIASLAEQTIAAEAAPAAAPEPYVYEPVIPAAAPEPAPAAEPTVPAGWYADPSGRFELRYWDGAAWTEHVSRAGQQFTDPPVA